MPKIVSTTVSAKAKAMKIWPRCVSMPKPGLEDYIIKNTLEYST